MTTRENTLDTLLDEAGHAPRVHRLASSLATQDESLTEERIFEWAQEYRNVTGKYPEAVNEHIRDKVPSARTSHTWSSVNLEITLQVNGLPAGLDLATLIESFHRIHVPLNEKRIMHWAKVHKRKFGSWPTRTSGVIDHSAAKPDTWGDVDAAFMLGQRGLKAGEDQVTNLAEFLDSYVEEEVEDLSEQKILVWAQAHRKLHGEYPKVSTLGSVEGSPEDTWKSLDFALERGIRGLAKRKPKDSLYWFLERKVGIAAATRKATPVSDASIIEWARQFVAEHGRFPDSQSGQVPGVTITWEEITLALEHGTRGLAGNRTLASVLENAGVRDPAAVDAVEAPKATEDSQERLDHSAVMEVVLADSGPIAPVAEAAAHLEVVAADVVPAEMSEVSSVVTSAVDEKSVDTSQPEELAVAAQSEEFELVAPDPAMLAAQAAAIAAQAQALAEPVQRQRGRRQKQEQQDLFALQSANVPEASAAIEASASVEEAVEEVLFSREDLSQWITSHYAFFRELPTIRSGKISASGNRLSWHQVQNVLIQGWDDVPAGTSLSIYLKKYRFNHIPLTVEKVLSWIDEYRLYAGEYPDTEGTEMILGASGETWKDIDRALREGQRGLPSGQETCTLAEFIKRHRLAKDKPKGTKPVLSNLNQSAIIAWAREFERATGRLPRVTDGTIPGTTETWAGINAAMSDGTRGFESGSTLRDFLAKHLDAAPRVGRPKSAGKVINRANLLHWIEEYREENAEFPEMTSGKIPNTPFSWRAVAAALAKGENDLPGGSSLKQFIYDEFGVLGNRVVSRRSEHSHA